jgi:hypothetical protein
MSLKIKKEKKKKKDFELLQRHLSKLKILIISFSPNAPQKSRLHHLPHDNTLRATIIL